jgi:replication-associated recombination protein RarA
MVATQRREFAWPTVLGYDFYEVLSAMQKTIRRGLEEDALYWGTELYLSEYADHAWNRLLVISSEDVGLASTAGMYVKVLNDMYRRDKKSGEARLYFTHAILLLARSPKSRIVDHATIASFEGPREKRALPD